jgi:hypothetical protein
VLAALGSLYLLWYKAGPTSDEKAPVQYPPSEHSRHETDSDRHPSPTFVPEMNRSPGAGTEIHGLGIHSTPSNDLRLIPTITIPAIERSPTANTAQRESGDEPTAGRPRVRQWFTTAANYLGNAAHQKLDVSDYKDHEAHRYPEVPGEKLRNRALERTDIQYSQLREQNSRAESTYAASIVSTPALEGRSNSPRPSSHPETSPSRAPKRRDTLEVPTPVHIHRRNGSH